MSIKYQKEIFTIKESITQATRFKKKQSSNKHHEWAKQKTQQIKKK